MNWNEQSLSTKYKCIHTVPYFINRRNKCFEIDILKSVSNINIFHYSYLTLQAHHQPDGRMKTFTKSAWRTPTPKQSVNNQPPELVSPASSTLSQTSLSNGQHQNVANRLAASSVHTSSQPQSQNGYHGR